MDDQGFLRDGESFEIRSSERGARLLLRRCQGGLIAEFDTQGKRLLRDPGLLGPVRE